MFPNMPVFSVFSLIICSASVASLRLAQVRHNYYELPNYSDINIRSLILPVCCISAVPGWVFVACSVTASWFLSSHR